MELNLSLSDGTNTLKDGTQELADGMSKFNNEGISKIVSVVNGDLKNIEGRVEGLKELAKEYNSFAGINDGDKGETEFVTIIDSLKKEDSSEEKTENAANNVATENANTIVANEVITNNETETSNE